MKSAFKQFYDHHPEQVQSLADEFPQDRSLRINYEDLQQFDADLAESFRTDPWETREQATDALEAREPTLTTHDALEASVRVHNLPEAHEYRVGKYRQHHLGQLLAVHGKVVGTDPVTPFAEVAAFECAHDDCRAITYTEQSYGSMIPPFACAECERKGQESEFDFQHDESDLVDHQEIVVMPADTNQDDPPMIPVHLKDDICDTVGKHDEIRVVGVYETFPGQKETVLSTYIEAFDLDVEEYAETDKESATDLGARIVEEVRDRQADGNWGVKESEIVEHFVSENFREEAVTEQISDRAYDASSNLDKQGDRLMVV